MPTLQVLANRRNAAKSTGPRTSRGKAITRVNAIRHGIHASLPVLAPGERRSAWTKFAAAILRELQPIGVLESLWAGRIALLQWRLLRCAQARQTLANQRWREAILTAPQTAWWQFRREQQKALPASLPDIRDYLRKNRRLQSLLTRAVTPATPTTSDSPPPTSLPTPSPCDPDTAIELIEWTAFHLNVDKRLAEARKNDHFPGIGRMPSSDVARYDWSLLDVRIALTEIAGWANMTLDRVLSTLIPAMNQAFNRMRRSHDRAVREVRRFRRVIDAQATHESQNIDRYEADLERRLQLAMNELRTLQHERAEERVLDAGNSPETSTQTRTDAHQTP